MSASKLVAAGAARRGDGDRRLCAGQERRVAGLAKVHKLSSNETPLGPSPRAIEAFRASRRPSRALSRRLGVARCARRSAGATASTPRRSSAAMARTISWPCSPMSICSPATKGSTPSTAFSNIRSPSAPPAATPVVADGERPDGRRRRAAGARSTPRTKVVFLANPNNPTGTYLPFAEVKRLHAGLPARYAAGARRGLCRICHAQRLRRGHRTRRDVRKRRDDAHLLENLRPRQSSHRLGLWAGARHRRAQPRPRRRSTSMARRSQRASPRWRRRAYRRRRSPHNASLAAVAEPKRSQALGIEVTPSVGNFLLLHFPRDRRPHGEGRPTPFSTARGFVLRAVAAYGLPDCLRLTVGTEEANRGVVAALDGVHERRRVAPDSSGAPLAAPIVERLAIDRLGLIGSSIARAARRRNARGDDHRRRRRRRRVRARVDGARARRRGRADAGARRSAGADLVDPLRAGRRQRGGRARDRAAR